MATANANKPSYETRIGRVKAVVFENENAPPKVVFSALYKNDEDQWRGSSSFTRDDLPLLMKVADQVHTHLYG